MSGPQWLEELLDSLCEACVNDVKGCLSGFSYRWSEPADNGWAAFGF
jgi:hypothetical protein